MSDANVNRRTALFALGVVTVAGLTTAQIAATGEQVGSEGAESLGKGCFVGIAGAGYRVVGQTGVEHGAITLTLADDAGDRFGVTLCARDDRDDSPRGPARTERFELFVNNEGSGDTPTDERRGLATMAVADGLRSVEHAVMTEGLLPLRERLARHVGELISALALRVRGITLGFGCNNACAFCAQGDLRGSSRRDELAEDAVRKAGRAHEAIALLGGEPTIDERLCDLVRLAKAEGCPRVVVQTNGRRLAYRAYAGALAEAGVDAVDVSLHGSTAAMHDYHTSVDGSFAQTVTGLGVAWAAGLVVGVSVVVTRSNYRHLAEIVRLVAARGVSEVRFADLVLAGRAADARERLVPPPTLVAPHLARARETARSLPSLELICGEPPETHPLFVGVGVVETRRSVPQRVALPLLAPVATPPGIPPDTTGVPAVPRDPARARMVLTPVK